MDRRVLALTATLVLAAVNCRSVPPLSNTHASPESLATAALEGLAQRDRSRLNALALSEQEFRDHVWPELPASRPERNLPFSYVWGDLHQKSELALSATLKEHGGKRYKVERVTFEERTPYTTFRVHRQTSLVVRDASGAESTIRICGSMIEKEGAWKVFSYVVDD